MDKSTQGYIFLAWIVHTKFDSPHDSR